MRGIISDTLGGQSPVSAGPMAGHKIAVTAFLHIGDGGREFTTTGQNARALLALVAAGPRGCTALEVSNWAYRFAAYTHELIHEYSLNIQTDREEHPGGWHGRHRLEDRVTILSVSECELRRKAAA